MNRVILIGNLTKDPEVNEMKDNLKRLSQKLEKCKVFMVLTS